MAEDIKTTEVTTTKQPTLVDKFLGEDKSKKILLETPSTTKDLVIQPDEKVQTVEPVVTKSTVEPIPVYLVPNPNVGGTLIPQATLRIGQKEILGSGKPPSNHHTTDSSVVGITIVGNNVEVTGIGYGTSVISWNDADGTNLLEITVPEEYISTYQHVNPTGINTSTNKVA